MKLISIALLVVFACFAQTTMAGPNFGDNLNLINAVPIAAITTSGDGTAVDMLAYDGQCAALLDVSAPVSGTTPGLAVKIKESATSGGSYTDVSGGGFTAVADDASVQKIVFNKDKQMRYLKVSRTISGTDSPQYLVSAKFACEKKYK